MEIKSKKVSNEQKNRSIIGIILHFITKNRNRVVLTIILAIITYISIDIALNWDEVKTAFIEGWNSVE